jgi:hypothetical protein
MPLMFAGFHQQRSVAVEALIIGLADTLVAAAFHFI